MKTKFEAGRLYLSEGGWAARVTRVREDLGCFEAIHPNGETRWHSQEGKWRKEKPGEYDLSLPALEEFPPLTWHHARKGFTLCHPNGQSAAGIRKQPDGGWVAFVGLTSAYPVKNSTHPVLMRALRWVRTEMQARGFVVEQFTLENRL